MSNYCTDIFDNSEILQGDIFKRTSPESEDEFFIIISADCDIANNKIGKSGLACLNILSLKDYFFEEHCVIKHQKKIDENFKSIIKIINEHWLALASNHKKIDGSNILKWILDDETNDILDTLQIYKKDSRQNIIKLIDIAKKYSKHKEDPECKSIDLLVIANGNNHCIDGDIKKITKRYLNELKNTPPQDLFFIPSIPTLNDIGYVVKLRSLFFTPIKDCYTSTSKAKENPESFIRIGRLTPTFKHALAQQFGTLFSRIGFPSYYEVDLEDSFSIFLENY